MALQLPTPTTMPGPSGLPSQDPQSTATLAKLAQILQMFGQKQQQGQAQGQPVNPVVSPARVPQIRFDPRGGASMPAPQAGPTSGGYQPPPFGAQMMEKLDPAGAATFSAIQGVSQVLQDFENRKQQREQAEASNIAQNLMQAIESGDVKTQQDILNDKHATKVLNKVYKGWLTKAQESQQPQEPPDPAVSGFEQGIKQHVQKKQQAQKRPQPQGASAYQMPQASPQRQLQNAIINANLQKAKQDPASMLESQLTSQETRQMQMIAGQLQVSPAEIQKIQMAENIAQMRAAVDLQKQAQKDQADYQKQVLANQGRENAATIAARAHVEAEQVLANARLQAVKYSVKYKTGVIPVAARMKLQALQGAQQMLGDMISGKIKTGIAPTMGASPYVQLTQLLKSAGLTQSATELPMLGTHAGGEKKLQEIKQNVDTYLNEYQKTLLSTATGSLDVSGSESDSGGSDSGGSEDELEKELDKLFPPDKPAPSSGDND